MGCLRIRRPSLSPQPRTLATIDNDDSSMLLLWLDLAQEGARVSWSIRTNQFDNLPIGQHLDRGTHGRAE